MASIYRLNNKWRASVITSNGRKTKMFERKEDAKLWSAKVQTSKDRFENPDQLLSDYFEGWYLTCKTDREPKTIHQYENTLANIKKYLPNATLQKFTRSDFQEFINNFGTDHSKQTVSKRKGHLAAALKDAYADELIRIDPTARINLVGQDGKDVSHKFMSKTDALKLIEYESQKNDIPSFLILTGILSGARIGELQALKHSDIQGNKIMITKTWDETQKLSKKPKTPSSVREITMPQSWLSVLPNGTGYLFGDEYPITSNGANKALRRDLNLLNIPVVTFHALRHTHASLLLSDDISMQYVSKRLGHKNMKITQEIYAHLLPEKNESEDAKAMDFFK
jgi:integrase